MKISVSFFIALMMIQTATSQIHEAGLLAGGGNAIGDVGATDYIAPGNIALGVIYKWNVATRYSYRASLMYTAIRGMDSASDIPARQDRDLAFRNIIREISAGMEFNFLEFNLHKFGTAVSPYVYSGLSYFNYDALYYDSGQALKYDTDYAFAIPIAVGIKGNIFNDFVIGLEVNVRYTFTDNLDGSNPSGSPFADSGFGNINSNDWYVFSGITVTYTFGRNPCYCLKK
ncbi:MAG: hypothetical protein KDD04_02895 [Sinomicrobium sp.]|nr:hypothetical protein [Sinomicrobium sp.]